MATSMFVKRLLANASCFGLLLLYVMLGGLLFLRFEREQSLRERDDLIGRKSECIRHFLRIEIAPGSNRSGTTTSSAERITEHCLFGIVDPAEGRRRQSWNYRNALLYGFGILTTLD
uniref:Ion_trans_2 domain-containing protein n=1 Tax=Globodera pallida TaxID=36090 RepID=A0A183C7V2_GLOPA